MLLPYVLGPCSSKVAQGFAVLSRDNRKTCVGAVANRIQPRTYHCKKRRVSLLTNEGGCSKKDVQEANCWHKDVAGHCRGAQAQ